MTDVTSSNDWQLGTYPRPLPLVRALARAESPFVMVNLLAFRQGATGEFEGRTGREVYQRYAHSIEAAQVALGSRLLWTGDLEAPPDGLPPFEVAALLQYASPRSFLRFAARGRSHGAARKAGLAGQWLIAAQTVDSAPWEVGDQAVLVELVGFGAVGESWLRERRRACTGLDGELIWRGRSISHVIGDGPHIDEVWVTGFADEGARDAGMEAIAGVARETGVETWWTYRATGSELLSRSPADTEG